MARASNARTAAAMSIVTLAREIDSLRHRALLGIADAVELRTLELLEFESDTRRARRLRQRLPASNPRR